MDLHGRRARVAIWTGSVVAVVAVGIGATAVLWPDAAPEPSVAARSTSTAPDVAGSTGPAATITVPATSRSTSTSVAPPAPRTTAGSATSAAPLDGYLTRIDHDLGAAVHEHLEGDAGYLNVSPCHDSTEWSDPDAVASIDYLKVGGDARETVVLVYADATGAQRTLAALEAEIARCGDGVAAEGLPGLWTIVDRAGPGEESLVVNVDYPPHPDAEDQTWNTRDLVVSRAGNALVSVLRYGSFTDPATDPHDVPIAVRDEAAAEVSAVVAHLGR
jgi:hypothetical protein